MKSNIVVNPSEPSLRYAWYVVVLLTLANISSFLDRQILALLVAPIKRDMHLNDTQVSLLMGLSFAMFYTVFGILIGRLADNTNRRNIIVAGVALWSVFTSMCAGVKNYTQFFFVRMGVGVGEATLSPSAYSIIADYFPKKKLGIAMSVFTMGIFLGSGFALAIGSGLVAKLPTKGMLHLPLFGDVFHWQLLFLMIGLPGLIISLLLLTVKEPLRKNKLQLGGEDAKLKLGEALKVVFKYPKTYISICLGNAFTAFVSYGCTAWIPTYFNRTFGWSVPKAGFDFGLVLLAASITGVLWGGWYADTLKNRGVLNGRMLVGVIAGIAMLASFFIPLIGNPNIVLGLLFILLFFVASPIGASTSAIQEIMPNQVRALSSSIFLFLLNIIGLGLGPTMVAVFTDYVLHDEMAIRYSLVALIIVGGFFSLLFYAISYRGYKHAVKLFNDEKQLSDIK
ncbi:MAG TPA: MFS transporter [Mucilaginibacter sp.]|jgi:MFS family permease